MVLVFLPYFAIVYAPFSGLRMQISFSSSVPVSEFLINFRADK